MNIKSILLGTTATLLITVASASAHSEKAAEPTDGKQVSAHHHAAKAKHTEKAKASHHKHAVAKAKPVATKPVKKIMVKTPVAVNTVLRSCGAYGPGYFTIPGTSTCLKLSGRLMGDITAGSDLTAHYLEFKDRSNAKIGFSAQGRLGVSSMSKSSLGQIHTYTEIRGGYASGLGVINYSDQEKREAESHNVTVHFAYAEIGGLRFGLDETLFNSWTGNFGAVEQNTILNPLTDMPLGTVNYTFNAGNGVSAIIGGEVYNGNTDGWQRDGNSKKNNRNLGENLNLVAGVKYTQGWGDIIGAAAYDGYYKSLSGRIRVDGNINENMTLWAMASVKNIKDRLSSKAPAFGKVNNIEVPPTGLKGHHFFRNSTRSPYGDWDGKWQALVGTTYKISPLTSFNAQFGYTAAKTIAASADVEYKLANGLIIVPELSYVAWHDTTKWKDKGDTEARTNWLKDKHEIQAMLHVGYKF